MNLICILKSQKYICLLSVLIEEQVERMNFIRCISEIENLLADKGN